MIEGEQLTGMTAKSEAAMPLAAGVAQPPSPGERLAQGMHTHQAGNLAEAERI